MEQAILIDLPSKVRGFSVRCFDDGEVFYRIFINSSLSVEQQRKTYLHEISHIENGDFDKEMSVGEIERLAHDDTRNWQESLQVDS